MSEQLRVYTLGGFSVERDGRVVSADEWPRLKTRNLLQVLLTSPGRYFTVDQLVEALLPDASPRAAISNIRARVSELRRTLEPGLVNGRQSRFVVRLGDGYAFRPGRFCWIDVIEFESAMARAQREADAGSWSTSAGVFEEALLLYRGEFLAENRYEEWAFSERRRLQTLFLEGLEALANCYAELGQLRRAISCCQRILGVEPCREGIIRRLMKYQAEAGQRAQALESYREGARALKSELGIEPAKETVELHRRISQSSSHVGGKLDRRRIGVLPFANYGPEAVDEYIAAGITEELIGCLARVKDFRVIARTTTTRYKESSKTAAQIGRELRAGTLLEGSVRRVENRICISIQLIDAQTEDHLWAEEYERDLRDVLEVQKSVARSVVSALRLELSREESRALEVGGRVNADAQELFLQGRYSFGIRTISHIIEAGECFRRALEIDPHHVLAKVGLAECLFQQPGMDTEGPRIAFAEGESILKGVLDAHPDLPEGHAALGYFRFFRQGAFDLGEESLRQAIALAPSLAKAHDWLAHLLMYTGRYDEALTEAKIAMDLDPLTPEYAVTTARVLLAVNRFAEADAALDETLRYDPENPQAPFWHTLSHHVQGNWDLAAAQIRQFGEASSSSEYVTHWLWARHHLCQGDLEASEAQARSAVNLHPVDLAPPPNMALAEVLFHRREYEASAELLGRVCAAFGSDWGVKTHAAMRMWAGLAFERLGRYGEALRELHLARDLFAWRYPWLIHWRDHWGDQRLLSEAAIGVAQHHAGDTGKARQSLAALRRRGREPHAAAGIAFLCFQLGEIDEGFDWLGRAVERHDRWLLTIRTNPWLDVVRSDSRLAGIVEALNRS